MNPGVKSPESDSESEKCRFETWGHRVIYISKQEVFQ